MISKFYITLAIMLTLFSCTSDQDSLQEPLEEETESTNARNLGAKGPSKVQLIRAWSQYSYYRGFSTYNRRFEVKVANIAPEKSVSVYHERLDGQWVEIPMEYSDTIDGKSEIWTLDYKHTGTQIYSDEFVIRYDVAGQTYWDDNQGKDYRMTENEGALIPENDTYLSVDQNYDALFPVFNANSKQFNVVVDLKNVSPEKSVQVVYTTDGWQTQSSAALDFNKYWYSGYNFGILSPNRFDVERWTGYISVPNTATTLEYAVVYRANGSEYWDNNYGKNYVVYGE